MLPSVENLRCFIAAADTLNFSAAARSVALTPAALGQRVRALETELGTPLFHRTTRTVQLTDAGHALLPYARRAVQSSLDCARAVRGELGPSPLSLCLGAPPELAAEWLAPLISDLSRARPDLTLHLHVAHDEELRLRLRSRDIDLAVIGPSPRDPRIESLHLFDLPLALVASESLLRAHPLESPAASAGHTLLDLSVTAPLFDLWRTGAGPSLRQMRFGRVLGLGALSVIEALLCRGDGVAVLPKYRIDNLCQKTPLRVDMGFFAPGTLSVSLCLRSGDPRRPALLSVAKVLRENNPARSPGS